MRVNDQCDARQKGASEIGSINSPEFVSILQGVRRKILDYRGFKQARGSNVLMVNELSHYDRSGYVANNFK